MFSFAGMLPKMKGGSDALTLRDSTPFADTTIGHQGSYTSLAQEVQANSKAGPQLVGADFGQFQNQTLWREPCRRLKYKSDA